MSMNTPSQSILSRRRFLTMSALGGGTFVLAACGGGGASAPAATATVMPPTATPEPPAATAEPVLAAGAPQDADVFVMVKDVLDYQLEVPEWDGGYGWVKFQLHEGIHNGDSVYFIRTDASDQGFAEQEGLVFVPLLNVAAGMENVNSCYFFEDGRPQVVAFIPGDENYSSLFKVKMVKVVDESAELFSAEAVEQAALDGGVTIEEPNIYLNHPLVQWPGGGLTVDTEYKDVLSGGQLVEAADTNNMEVTMKLHQCFPGSRYILTDTGAAPMAPMMSIPAASPTEQLTALGGTDEIWVFGNGIPGPGVMGYQPAIFDNKAGQPAWSPFWQHFTVTWVDDSRARVLRTSTEIRELVDSGELEQWNGVPDSHPNGFVVNCPAPILAPNTFDV